MGKKLNYIYCPTTGKRSFDEHEADKALGRAQHKRRRQATARGSMRGLRMENRFYYHADCDGYHLTAESRRDYQTTGGRAA